MQRTEKETIILVNEAMLRVKNGDKDAVALLFDLTYRSLYHVAYRYSKDRLAAEDLTTDVFANIDYIASLYSKGQNAFNYMCKCVKNRFLNTLRYKKRHETTELCENLAASYANIEERVQDIDVRRALMSLDREEFDIINMKFYMDMTFREIAAAKGMSLGKVQRIYNKAVAMLKKLL